MTVYLINGSTVPIMNVGYRVYVLGVTKNMAVSLLFDMDCVIESASME